MSRHFEGPISDDRVADELLQLVVASKHDQLEALCCLALVRDGDRLRLRALVHPAGNREHVLVAIDSFRRMVEEAPVEPAASSRRRVRPHVRTPRKPG